MERAARACEHAELQHLSAGTLPCLYLPRNPQCLCLHHPGQTSDPSMLLQSEIHQIKLTGLWNILSNSIFSGGPIAISLASFSVYIFLGHALTPEVAFPALALFNLLRFPVLMLVPLMLFCCGSMRSGKGDSRCQGVIGYISERAVVCESVSAYPEVTIPALVLITLLRCASVLKQGPCHAFASSLWLCLGAGQHKSGARFHKSRMVSGMH